MHPFVAICLVALHPLARHLFHAHDAVLVVLKVLVALHAEDDSLFHEVLLILQLVGADTTL
jgi:DUF1009 family protein